MGYSQEDERILSIEELKAKMKRYTEESITQRFKMQKRYAFREKEIGLQQLSQARKGLSRE